MDKATGTDKYNVTYKMYDMSALDLANNGGKTLEEILSAATPVLTGEYTLSNVEDTQKPTVKIAGDYTVTSTTDPETEVTTKTVSEEDEETLQDTDYSYLMPSVVRVDQADVEIPAIYAYDNYSSYNGIAKTSLTRTIK